MKLILLENVNNLGSRGEIIEIKEGYGRNYLIPNGLAVLPSDIRAKQIKEELAQKEEQKKENSEKLHELAGAMNGKELSFKVKAEKNKLFGAITAKDIAKKLNISEKQIILTEPIKELGEQSVKINLGEGALAEVKVRIEKE